MTHNREKGELRERCMQLQSRVDQQSKHIKRLQEDKDEKLTSSLIKTKVLILVYCTDVEKEEAHVHAQYNTSAMYTNTVTYMYTQYMCTYA